MKKIPLCISFAFMSICTFAQQIKLEELIYSLDLSNKDKISYFEDKGFTLSIESLQDRILLEKIASSIPQYQRIDISYQDGSTVYMSNDGSYSSRIITSYPEDKYTITKKDDAIVLRDRKRGITVGFSTITKTSIPYYAIIVGYSKMNDHFEAPVDMKSLMDYASFLPNNLIDILSDTASGWHLISKKQESETNRNIVVMGNEGNRYKITESYTKEDNYMIFERPYDENEYKEYLKYLLGIGMKGGKNQIISGKTMIDTYTKKGDYDRYWKIKMTREINSEGSIIKCKIFFYYN